MKLAASNSVKVVLDGQGSDEVLAGYSKYFHDYWYTLLRTAQGARAWHEMRGYATRHRASARELGLHSLGRLVHHQLRRLGPYPRLPRRLAWRRVRPQRQVA